MWVCLNNGFVSIVEDRYNDTLVFVRSRRLSDLKNFLDKNRADIKHTPSADYQYRAHISKAELADCLIQASTKITYDNFKSSVKDVDLSHFYNDVWVSGINNLDFNWYKRHNVSHTVGVTKA
jgi:hypothetical protein